MKILSALLTFFILIISSSSLHADIDAQIEAIRRAPVAERFKLMNAFKQEIVQMKEEERIHAITQLKGITKSKYANRAINEIKNHSRVKHDKEDKHERSEEERNNEETIETESNDQIENDIGDNVENETEDQIAEDTEDQIETEIENEIGDDNDDD